MSWRHLKDERPKARKAHPCNLCGEQIEIGEVHVNRSGVSDGELIRFRMHIECNAWASDNWDADEWYLDTGDFERPTNKIEARDEN